MIYDDKGWSHGDIWGYNDMMIYDDIWWYMMIYDDKWWYMMIYGDMWWYRVIFDDVKINEDK